MMDEGKIQMMLNRMAIIDTVNRYAQGIDMHDWATFRSCFTDEIEFDASSWSETPPTRIMADDWVDLVRQTVSVFTATQHTITNHVITVDEDKALCVAYVQAQHYLNDDQEDRVFTLGGYYTKELLRNSDGWKIRKYALTVTWKAGDQKLFELLQKRFDQED